MEDAEFESTSKEENMGGGRLLKNRIQKTRWWKAAGDGVPSFVGSGGGKSGGGGGLKAALLKAKPTLLHKETLSKPSGQEADPQAEAASSVLNSLFLVTT